MRSRLRYGLAVLLLALPAALYVLPATLTESPPEPRDPLVTRKTAEPSRAIAPTGAPNLVLVIGCTVRRDQVSIPWRGQPTGSDATPFLASLAERGARLDDLVSAAPWTRAASAAILTGRHPISLGMIDEGKGFDHRALDESALLLAEHLHAHGYATLGMTTNPNLNDVYGLAQGFDAYRELARLWKEDGVKLPGTVAVDSALDLLDDARPLRGPVYLQILLVDAHAPHTATADEIALVRQDGLPESVAAYRVALGRLDTAVRALHDGLAERGYDESNTVLAFVSDHGEGLSFPPHHGRSHGRYLAPSSVGSLLVATGPGLPPGHVVSGVASQIDLAPTLVSLLGLPPMPAEGQDLSLALRGGASSTGERVVFSDTWFKEVSRSARYSDTVACQHDFIGLSAGDKPDGFVDGCFDRASDPDHTSPYRDEALEAEIIAWRERHLAERPAQGAAERPPSEGIDRQLRALGYLD